MGRQTAKSEAEISITAVTAEDLLEIGMKYCTGHDVSQTWWPPTSVHPCPKGSESAKQYRCEISREMSPADVADAQRQARPLTLH
jgi:hypothetical protein